ncbi:hypothetical protein L1049_018692 [Liquidambar formosana]|uniref:F-box domain-containing protein n=1 Tax=Liquidambar formosana TaxID=63359 RepID=A0AAP0WNN7_LIQFO
METCMDFLNWLERDMAIKILMCLDDPSDLVRVSTVSRSWHDFVIESGLFKQLCLRMFPQLSSVARVIESSCRMREPADVGSSSSMEWESLERDHKVYACLARVRGCTSLAVRNCISLAISASSTDNYPEESIDNTLHARDIIAWRPSYWSSKGQSDPAVPETLIYKLVSDLCVITEINIHPFQADFQSGSPIYSAKSVRFQMGHPKSPMNLESDLMGAACQQSADDKFVWTYNSQEFSMAQENRLQKFELPEPVLCIGGILQIELLGRVQRQEMDGLFYICVSHVNVMGHSLSPSFDVQILEPSGKFLLEYCPEASNYSPEDEPCARSGVPILPTDLEQQINVRGWEQILIMLRGNPPEVEDNEHDDPD